MRIHIVKVGNQERPATDEDIKAVAEEIDAFEKKYNLKWPVFVTHHAVEVTAVDVDTNLQALADQMRAYKAKCDCKDKVKATTADMKCRDWE